MHPNAIVTARAATQTISIAAPPVAVFEVIADPLRLPEWAPTFARAVEPVGKRWKVTTWTGQEIADVVAVREPAWTVDIVRGAHRQTAGPRLRAIPSDRGSELIYTTLFPLGTADAVVDARTRAVGDELETIRALSVLARGRIRF